MGGSDNSPATAAVIVGFLALTAILAVLIVYTYRRRQKKQATVVPAWEASERGRAENYETCQALENEKSVQRHHVETAVDRVRHAEAFIEDALPGLGHHPVEQLLRHLLGLTRPLQESRNEAA